jgi:hypothetical protein
VGQAACSTREVFLELGGGRRQQRLRRMLLCDAVLDFLEVAVHQIL